MPAIEKPTFFARMRQTSMSDLIRLRLSSGVTDAMIIKASALDVPTRELIASICKKTRLWSDERADVARELVAHFQDGLAAGQKSDALIRSFGDTGQAAKLIRRAKIRNRSGFWHVKRFCLRALGVIVLGYLGLAVYYYTGKPNISTDYIAKLNERVGTVAEADRAWPLYRRLNEMLEADPALADRNAFSIFPEASPKKWAKVVAWLKANPTAIGLAEEAAEKPKLGFIYGPDGSSADLYKTSNSTPANRNDPLFNSIISVLLPYLNEQRQAANLLAADAKLATEEGDASRWMKRIDQLHRVSLHSRDPGFLVNYLVSIGIESVRLVRINDMLAKHPNLLSDAQLAELAHRNTWFGSKDELINYEAERFGFQDVVQRIYTDDGNGDGRVSPRGLDAFGQLQSAQSGSARSSEVLKFIASPAAAFLMASRKELMEKYNTLMDRAEARLHKPWRSYAGEPLFIDAQGINSSTRQWLKYNLMAVLIPAVDRVGVTAERVATQRDAMQVAIALELFNRRTGSYPSDLSQLAPMLLPAVPADPCDGQPMRYRLVDGKPVIYSVGVDLDDDGGLFPVIRSGQPAKPAPHEFVLAIGESAVRYDGDWILYPLPRDATDEEEVVEPSPVVEASTQP